MGQGVPSSTGKERRWVFHISRGEFPAPLWGIHLCLDFLKVKAFSSFWVRIFPTLQLTLAAFQCLLCTSEKSVPLSFLHVPTHFLKRAIRFPSALSSSDWTDPSLSGSSGKSCAIALWPSWEPSSGLAPVCQWPSCTGEPKTALTSEKLFNKHHVKGFRHFPPLLGLHSC